VAMGSCTEPLKTGDALYPWALLNPLTLLVCDSFDQPAHLPAASGSKAR
jgi:hypothetical protein